MRKTAQLLTHRENGRKLVESVTLTTDHAMSSYGAPVVLWRGAAHGPAELPGVLVSRDPVAAGRAEAAGFRVAHDLDEAARLLG